MSDRMMVATRKGLLTFERGSGGWKPAGEAAFPGSPVVNVLHDPRDGTIYAALKLGHFGPKMHRSDDGGKTWKEITSPAFPADAAGSPSVFQVWSLETGGPGLRYRAEDLEGHRWMFLQRPDK